MAALTRESTGSQPSVDLWDSIALRLPALDAQREEQPLRSWVFPAHLIRPLTAFAVMAAVAYVAIY